MKKKTQLKTKRNKTKHVKVPKYHQYTQYVLLGWSGQYSTIHERNMCAYIDRNLGPPTLSSTDQHGPQISHSYRFLSVAPPKLYLATPILLGEDAYNAPRLSSPTLVRILYDIQSSVCRITLYEIYMNVGITCQKILWVDLK